MTATGDGYAAQRRALLDGSAQPGAPRRAALAKVTDSWLARLHGRQAEGTALVAVGGYGRAELSPASDLDLLLLHDGRAAPAETAALADRLWYPVWDQGLALDHSVRTPAEAREAAAQDLRVQLGLLDARHLAGDPRLTAGVRTAALAAWRAEAGRRLPELLELTRERARRHGELRFLLEPDLKEAQGGLRDATALRAVAASWLTDAPREGLAEARSTLLDVRDALHLATGRTTDRLALQDQDEVAGALALPDADALLRRVYEAARTIGYAADVTWRDVTRILRARSGPSRRRPGRALRGARFAQERRPLADGVVAFDGEVSPARDARPERDPVLPLRVAAAAARAGLPLSPPAVRRLARTAAPLPVPWPAQARQELVTLLGAGEPAVRVWEALDAVGLVTALLPDWERVRCRPQRNPVHRWTVDRHLVETAVRASALTRRVRRPDLLLLGALLHDIGKGLPGDHSVAGEAVARETAARIGLGPADVDVLGTLVRHHLLLAETATRRDLDDPATVRTVAAAVGRRGTLELLHALTEADARATGPAVWSSWRAALVSDLVERVEAVLAGEPAVEQDGPYEPDPRTEPLVAEARRTGGPALALAAEPHGAGLLVVLPDRPGALPAVAGVLSLHRLTVRAADLRLLPPAPAPAPADGADTGPAAVSGPLLVLSWRVAAEYGAPPASARLRADLVRVLEGTLDVEARLAEREAAHSTPRRCGRTSPGTSRMGAPPTRSGGPSRVRSTAGELWGRTGPPSPRVTVAPAGSRFATVLEVRAQDAPGLLYRVARALEHARVRVRSAHVSTLGADAVDAFYVTGADGSPLAPEQAAVVAQAVQRALCGRVG